MVGRAIRARHVAETRGRANGRKGAPDCPVCTGQCPVRQRLQSANGWLRQRRKEIRTGLSGAPGDRRQELPSWNALNGSYLPWGYKGTPRRMEEHIKHSLSIPKHQDFDSAHLILCDSN
jgi:hypothetical protein